MWERLFRREEYVNSLGYQIDEKGYTSNLYDYVKHVRENLAGKSQRYFNVYAVWATISGAITYFVCAYALND
jgi:hypothetical protein